MYTSQGRFDRECVPTSEPHESILGLAQDAAGVFAELRDVVSLRVEAPRPVDISPECANMLERLCLAQAQELTFEKFRADGKNPGILARWRSLLCMPVPLTHQPIHCFLLAAWRLIWRLIQVNRRLRLHSCMLDQQRQWCRQAAHQACAAAACLSSALADASVAMIELKTAWPAG